MPSTVLNFFATRNSIFPPLKTSLFALLLIIGAAAQAGVQYEWMNFAGEPGGGDSLALGASFNTPVAAAVDSQGNVYVADAENHLIRKISAAGIVSTLAGSGSIGFADGTGSAAAFFTPHGVAVDNAGNVFVADRDNHRIRKVTPAGVVTTVAGGTAGFADGTGSAARFALPQGLAVDAGGNMYVADTGNRRIRKITPSGQVTTVAGSGATGNTDGAGTGATFSGPIALAVNAGGEVFVTDHNNHRIRKIALNGEVSTFAGSAPGYADGTGIGAQFLFPNGVAVDENGDVYVADSHNNRIRKITPAGVVTTLAGNGTIGDADGIGTAARFSHPTGVAVDTDGNVFVSDPGNHRIRRVAPDGGTITWAGNGAAGNADGSIRGPVFALPYGAAVDAAGNVYVADAFRNRIWKITPAGVISTLAGSGSPGFADGTGTGASFNNPSAIAVAPSGNVYVADTNNYRIRKITSAGVVSTLAGSSSPGFADGTGTGASFDKPRGVAVDVNGNVHVADTDNHLIRKITPGGVVTTLAGSGNPGFADGTGAGASFDNPTGVAVDADGHVYVADTNNHLIRKITPGGVVTTRAGSGSNGFADGTGAAASFDNPTGVAVSASGNLYVADANNSRIRKITPDDAVTTLAGSSPGYADGTGAAAAFDNPSGVALDTSGNVYVADTGNSRIRKVTQAGVVSTVAGSPSFADGPGGGARFSFPSGVAADADGNVYVADTDNFRIRKITPMGFVSTLAGSGFPGSVNGAGATATFNNSRGVAVDANGNVYVADAFGQLIRKITPAGVVSTLAGSGSFGFADGTGAAASFDNPQGVAADADGNVYVADTGNYRIRTITPGGMVTTLAGSGSFGSTDGTGAGASFDGPQGVAVDANGNVYVADTGNHKVRKITPLGVVSTLAGSGSLGFADGTGAGAKFRFPIGVAVDASGHGYLADTGNKRIRKIAPDGVVTTIGGPGILGWTSEFGSPDGLAISPNGSVYFASPDASQVVIGKPIFHFGSAGEVPLETPEYTASAQRLKVTLGFTPQDGALLTLVNNTGATPIAGEFENVPDGSSVSAAYNGVVFPFIIDYQGGDGNDITLSFSQSTQSISFTSIGTRNFSQSSFALSARSNRGLGVSFRVLGGPARISGNLLTMTGLGTVQLEAFNSGDALTNPASSTQSFRIVDTTDPRLTIDTSLRSNSGQISLKGKVSDNHIVKTIEYRIQPPDGKFGKWKQVSLNNTIGPKKFTFSVSTPDAGTYLLELHPIDQAGNQGGKKRVKIQREE